MKKRRLLIVLCIVAALLTVFFVYVGTYSRATPEAQAAAASMENINGNLLLRGGSAGVILYPGGKVDEAAYAPLAHMLNERGFTVAIVKMPFHLAIFSPDRAQAVIDSMPEVERWVIAGHSLGGTAAGMYAAENAARLSGIVFLGSYPYRDLSGTSLTAMVVTAGNDRVLDHQKANEAKPFLPANTYYVQIPGGNHAGFGCYGPQSGDGEATVSQQVQQQAVADNIAEIFG